MTAAAEQGDRFLRHLGLVAVAGVAGVLGAYFLSRAPGDRLGALVGVGGSVLAGALAMVLKRRAVARGLNWALGMMGATFGLRMVLVAAGLVYVMRAGLGAMAFTLGFFGVYLVLQWNEITYVLAEAKRRGRGGSA